MKRLREKNAGVKPFCVWITGLSGAGKSTLAGKLYEAFQNKALTTVVLDGDRLRAGLNSDLGFTLSDRAESVRRVSEVARYLADAGLIVIVALISPVAKERDTARRRFPVGEFIEIFVDTPLSVCEDRDPKGLYRRARQGLIEDLTGVGSDYEPPHAPDFHVRYDGAAPDSVCAAVLAFLRAGGFLDTDGPHLDESVSLALPACT